MVSHKYNEINDLFIDVHTFVTNHQDVMNVRIDIFIVNLV